MGYAEPKIDFGFLLIIPKKNWVFDRFFWVMHTFAQNWAMRLPKIFYSVDSGLISSRVKPMTFKLVFTASLLDAQHQRDSLKNKPTSLLVVPLGKALSGIPHLGVVDKWPATPKRAGYSTLIAFW